MSDKFKASSTVDYEGFFKRLGMEMPNRIHINRELFNQEELECFENYFNSLCIDLTLLNQLFGTDESVSVLNEFNDFIFCRIQNNLIEKICLKIACLMVPAKSGRKEIHDNLSLHRLVTIADNSDLTEAYEKLKNSYEETGIKIWRHKVLAHTDLKTVLGQYDFDLNLTRDVINELIREIQDILDLIKDPDVYTDTEVTLPFDKNAGSFIAKLKLINERSGA